MNDNGDEGSGKNDTSGIHQSEDFQPPSPTGYEYYLLLGDDAESSSEARSYSKHVLPLGPCSLKQTAFDARVLYGLEKHQLIAVRDVLRERNHQTIEKGQWVVVGLHVMDSADALGVVIKFYGYGTPLNVLEICLQRKAFEAECQEVGAIMPRNTLVNDFSEPEIPGQAADGVSLAPNSESVDLKSHAVIPNADQHGKRNDIRWPLPTFTPASEWNSAEHNRSPGTPFSERDSIISASRFQLRPVMSTIPYTAQGPSSETSNTFFSHAARDAKIDNIDSIAVNSSTYSGLRTTQNSDDTRKTESFQSMLQLLEDTFKDTNVKSASERSPEPVATRIKIDSAEYLEIKKLADKHLLEAEWEQAEPFLKKMLAVQKKALGDHDRKTLQTLHNLGRAYKSLGRPDDAEQFYKRALEGRTETLGEDHLDTLHTMHNLANTYEDLKRQDEAEKLRLRGLETKRKRFGEDHRHTLAELNNIAHMYRKLDRLEEAEQYYKRALEGEVKRFGVNHKLTLNTMFNLAETYQLLNQLQSAELLYERVLEGRTEILEENHELTLSTMHNLADTYWKLGRVDDAEKLFRRTLEGKIKKYGENHNSTSSTSWSLAQSRGYISSKLDIGM